MADLKKSALRAEAAISTLLLDADSRLYDEDKEVLEKALDIIRNVRKLRNG